MKKTTAALTPTSKLAGNGSKVSLSAVERIAPIGFDPGDGITVLLYGQSGTGKTTTWATFPKPILVLICSGGDKPGELRSIDTDEYRNDIHQVVLQNTQELPELVEYAQGRYETIVLDHATGFQDKVLAEIIGLEELPAQKTWGMASQQQYGQCTLQCKDHLRKFLSVPCNRVIVAQEREFKGDGESDLIMPFVGAGLTPSLAGWLNTAVDYIFQTYKKQKEEMKRTTVGSGDKAKVIETRVKTREVEFCLRTAPDPVYTTKFRLPKGSPLPDYLVDPSYEKIMEIIRGAG